MLQELMEVGRGAAWEEIIKTLIITAVPVLINNIVRKRRGERQPRDINPSQVKSEQRKGNSREV